MHGNSGGGGGGFMLGYMMASDPAATAMAAVVIAALVVGGLGVYAVADHMDQPHRAPIVAEMVDNSIKACTNAESNEALYTVKLKDDLMGVWSSDLQKFKEANPNLTICEDAALNNFVVPYKYDQVGTHYTGEYRVMGVFYKHADGSQVLVVKPKSETRAPNSIDSSPDSPLGMNKIFDAVSGIPSDVQAYKLPDGTSVSVFLQQDGITQQHGSSTTHDNDGKGWADQERLGQIQQHYNFAWPAQVAPSSVTFTPS